MRVLPLLCTLAAVATAASTPDLGDVIKAILEKLLTSAERSAQFQTALPTDPIVETVRSNLSMYSFSVRHSSASSLPLEFAGDYVTAIMAENQVSGKLSKLPICSDAMHMDQSVEDLACEDADTLRYFWLMCVPSQNFNTSLDIMYGTGVFSHDQLSSKFCAPLGGASQTVQRIAPATNLTGAQAVIVNDRNSWTNHSVLVMMDILQYETAHQIVDVSPDGIRMLAQPMAAMDLSSILAGLTSLKTAVDGFVSTWQNIVNAFKTVESEKVTRIVQLGFKDYAQHSVVSKTIGLPSQYQVEYAQALLSDYQFPTQYKSFVMGIEFASDFAWEAMDGVYQDGSYKVKTVVKNGDLATMMANYLVCDLQISFTLDDDLLDIVTHKSVAGGIWDTTTEKYQSIPHDLTLDDVEKLMNFFRLVQMQAMSDVLNATITSMVM
jgi:hypothetical protein